MLDSFGYVTPNIVTTIRYKYLFQFVILSLIIEGSKNNILFQSSIMIIVYCHTYKYLVIWEKPNTYMVPICIAAFKFIRLDYLDGQWFG